MNSNEMKYLKRFLIAWLNKEHSISIEEINENINYLAEELEEIEV